MSLSTNDMIELNRQSIEKIEKEIIEAGKHITQIEENIEAAIKGNNIEEVDYLRNEEEHLRNKEAQLRNEKAQLRDKELLLLKTKWEAKQILTTGRSNSSTKCVWLVVIFLSSLFFWIRSGFCKDDPFCMSSLLDIWWRGHSIVVFVTGCLCISWLGIKLRNRIGNLSCGSQPTIGVSDPGLANGDKGN